MSLSPKQFEQWLENNVSLELDDEVFYKPRRVRQLYALLVPRWVPVEERLPEETDDYLILRLVGGNPYIELMAYVVSAGWCQGGVTHWMPLPPLPEVPDAT